MPRSSYTESTGCVLLVKVAEPVSTATEPFEYFGTTITDDVIDFPETYSTTIASTKTFEEEELKSYVAVTFVQQVKLIWKATDLAKATQTQTQTSDEPKPDAAPGGRMTMGSSAGMTMAVWGTALMACALLVVRL